MKIDRTHLRQIIREELEHLTENTNPSNPLDIISNIDLDIDAIGAKGMSILNKARLKVVDLLNEFLTSNERMMALARKQPGYIGWSLQLSDAVWEATMQPFMGPDFKGQDVDKAVIHALRVVPAVLKLVGDEAFHTKLADGLKLALAKGLSPEAAREELASIVVNAINEDIAQQPMRADQNLHKAMKALGLD